MSTLTIQYFYLKKWIFRRNIPSIFRIPHFLKPTSKYISFSPIMFFRKWFYLRRSFVGVVVFGGKALKRSNGAQLRLKVGDTEKSSRRRSRTQGFAKLACKYRWWRCSVVGRLPDHLYHFAHTNSMPNTLSNCHTL